MLLKDILNPINQTSFIYNAVIGQKLVHIKSENPNIYSTLINDSIIDNYLNKVSQGRKHPFNRSFKFEDMIDYVPGSPMRGTDHFGTDDGKPKSCETITNFYKILNNGHTVIIKDIGRFKDEGEPIYKLLKGINAIFKSSGRLWCNLFISKSRNALAPHVDKHAIIVLQYKGEKNWDFFGEVSDWKTNNPVHKIVLKQGDFLYFPKWAPHYATTSPGIETGHATIEIPSDYSRYAKFPQEWLGSQSK